MSTKTGAFMQLFTRKVALEKDYDLLEPFLLLRDRPVGGKSVAIARYIRLSRN